jgi:hypothetical protein
MKRSANAGKESTILYTTKYLFNVLKKAIRILELDEQFKGICFTITEPDIYARLGIRIKW